MRRYLSGRLAKRLRDSEGTSLVEAAMIAPLLVLLTFAIVDFGALLFIHLALQSGVSQASRFGVTGNVATGLSREDSMRLAMRQNTPLFTLDDSAFTFSHLSGGVWVGGAGAPGDVEKIGVTYNWQIMTPWISPFFPTTGVNFYVESSMKNETF